MEAIGDITFKRIQPGDKMVVWTGNIVDVKRVNSKSVTSTLGVRYKQDEIYKIIKVR